MDASFLGRGERHVGSLAAVLGHLPQSALYVVWAGANDFLDNYQVNLLSDQRRYWVQQSTDLRQWTDVGELTPVSGQARLTVPTETGGESFFRVKVESAP